MFRLRQHPYHLFLWTAILIYIASAMSKDRIMDIHLHDTYYVFSSKYLMWTIVIVLMFLWIINRVCNNIISSKKLTWFHVIISMAGLIAIAAISIYTNRYSIVSPMPGKSYTGYNDFLQLRKFDDWYFVSAVLVALGILVFIINLARGIIKRGD
jgi:hypothetical protein